MIGIYKIINTTNNKYYVGSSMNIERRWKSHNKHLRGNYHENDHLQKSWNKYGSNVFKFVIIEQFSNECLKKELLVEEQKWLDIAIKERNKTYNLTFIAGGGTLGGKDSPNFGRHHSLESRKKMSISKLGFKHSDITKQKMSVSKSKCVGSNHPRYGTHHSEDTKLKLSKSYEFINPDGNIVKIQNLNGFCSKNGLDTSTMCKVFRGKLKQYKKWRKV